MHGRGGRPCNAMTRLPNWGNMPTVDPDPGKGFVKQVLDLALTAPGFIPVSVVFGIGILVTFLSKFGVALTTVALGILSAFMLSILYLALTWVRRLKPPHTARLAIVFAHAVVYVAVTSLILCFSSIFLNGPLPIRDYIVRQMSDVPVSPNGSDPTRTEENCNGPVEHRSLDCKL
jgi:hypothetical protein